MHVPISHATLQCTTTPLRFGAPSTRSIILENGGLKALSGSTLKEWVKTKEDKSKKEQHRKAVSDGETKRQSRGEGDRAGCF